MVYRADERTKYMVKADKVSIDLWCSSWSNKSILESVDKPTSGSLHTAVLYTIYIDSSSYS